MNHLRLELRLGLKSSFHTTGNRWTWQADKALAKSPDDAPTIPATTLKGILRANAEAMLRSSGIAVCAAPHPSAMCRDRDDLCAVCRVFGNPRGPAKLRFESARPTTELVTAIRSGVAISRHRRAALAQRLFFVETAAGMPLEWVAFGEGYFPTLGEGQEAGALIWGAAKFCQAVGGGRSRGLGWIERWQVQVALDGQPLSEEELAAKWRSWLGGTL